MSGTANEIWKIPYGIRWTSSAWIYRARYLKPVCHIFGSTFGAIDRLCLNCFLNQGVQIVVWEKVTLVSRLNRSLMTYRLGQGSARLEGSLPSRRPVKHRRLMLAMVYLSDLCITGR
jgi:hypothetical protein